MSLTESRNVWRQLSLPVVLTHLRITRSDYFDVTSQTYIP